MRDPQDIHNENEAAKKDPDAKPAGLGSIDKERGHPGKGAGATVKPEDTGDTSLENRRQEDDGRSHGDPEGHNPKG